MLFKAPELFRHPLTRPGYFVAQIRRIGAVAFMWWELEEAFTERVAGTGTFFVDVYGSGNVFHRF